MNRSWYTDKANVASPDAIHQILAYGTLDDIKSLRNTLGENRLKELFLSYPKKVYGKDSLNFIKNFILKISNSIDEQKYLKNTPRSIR